MMLTRRLLKIACFDGYADNGEITKNQIAVVSSESLIVLLGEHSVPIGE